MKTISTRELCGLTGVPHGTICRLRHGGRLTPAVSGGPRVGDRWSISQALGILVGRALRSLGVSVPDAALVMEHLWDMPTELLEAHLTTARDCIMVVGAHAMPRLVSREAIFANPYIPSGPYGEELVAYAGATLPTGVDVGLLWRRLMEAVEKPATRMARR